MMTVVMSHEQLPQITREHRAINNPPRSTTRSVFRRIKNVDVHMIRNKL